MLRQLENTWDFKLTVQYILVILSASDIEQMQQTSLQSEAL